MLMLLGLGIPFWMEYKSLTNPPYIRRQDAERRVEIDPGRAFYCPACGGPVALPTWSEAAAKPVDRGLGISLRSLTTTTVEASGARLAIPGQAP
ncbi:MAG: hypothetical protein ACHQ49_12255 [Elusimicrobiota bacterium]